MPALVIAEHDNASLKAATLNTVTAALPPEAAAASKPVLRTVSTLVWSALCTVAMALPA